MATHKANVSVVSSMVSDDFISLLLRENGSVTPFMIEKTHATYPALRRALDKGENKKIPSLVTTARVIANKSNGKIQLTKDGVTYNGKAVHPVFYSYATRIQREGKDLAPWLRFLNNMFRNPEDRAIAEITEFIEKAENAKYPVPITDDGCFLGYKAVNSDYKDCHTGKYDNTVGAVNHMRRKDVDANRNNQCSRGFHFCSLGYLKDFGGQRIMAVKVNPRDIVAIPRDYNYSKGRTWRYEVVYEVSDKNSETDVTHAPVMLQTVVPVAAERKELLKQLLDIPAVKRGIRRGKIKKSTIVKQTYGRLVKLFSRYQSLIPAATTPARVTEANTLKIMREKAGLSIGEVAKEMGISYKGVWALEKSENPRQNSMDAYIEAVESLTKKKQPKAAAAAATASYPQAVAESYRATSEEEVVEEDEDYGYEEDSDEDEEDEDNDY